MLNPNHPTPVGAEIVTPEATGGVASPTGSERVKVPRPPRPPSIRYLGFRATAEGREYSLQVNGEGEPRLFLFFIGHPVFASRQLSFQDAPDLCYARMQGDLIADPELLPGPCRELTAGDLIDYHRARQSPASGRRRRASANPDRGTNTPFAAS